MHQTPAPLIAAVSSSAGSGSKKLSSTVTTPRSDPNCRGLVASRSIPVLFVLFFFAPLRRARLGVLEFGLRGFAMVFSPGASDERNMEVIMNSRDNIPENPIEVRQDELESARRIGITLTEAARVFGSSQQALEWMGEQNLALHGQKPADVAAASEEGLVRVLQIIGRIDYGVYE